MYLSDSEKGQVAGSCEHITEPLGSTHCRLFFDLLRNLRTVLHGAGSSGLMNYVVA